LEKTQISVPLPDEQDAGFDCCSPAENQFASRIDALPWLVFVPFALAIVAQLL